VYRWVNLRQSLIYPSSQQWSDWLVWLVRCHWHRIIWRYLPCRRRQQSWQLTQAVQPAVLMFCWNAATQTGDWVPVLPRVQCPCVRMMPLTALMSAVLERCGWNSCRPCFSVSVIDQSTYKHYFSFVLLGCNRFRCTEKGRRWVGEMLYSSWVVLG